MAGTSADADSELIGISTDYWLELRRRREANAKPSWIGQYSTITFSIQNTVLFLQSILVACIKLGVVTIPWLYALVVAVSFIQAAMLLITNYRSYWNLFKELRQESANFFKKFIEKFKRLKDLPKCSKEECWEIIADILNELLILNVVLFKTLGSAVATKGFLDSHVSTSDSLVSNVTFGAVEHGGNVVNNALVVISTPGVAISLYSLFSRVNDRQHNYRVQKLLDETTEKDLKNSDDPSTKLSFRLVLCHFFAISYGILDALLYSEAMFRAAAVSDIFSATTLYLSPVFFGC